MTVWDDLVGQQPVIDVLQRAVRDRPSHAWLFTGPPGSGRSNAALAFAAALQCERGGCGQEDDQCHSCHTASIGSHEAISVTRTTQLSIGVDQVRQLVRDAALAPVGDRYQIMVVEDADRLTEQAANALLKAIEEPSARTIWLLCAPTVEDVLPTIRSRARLVVLSTPQADDVAEFLVRKVGVDPERARLAASASQGHIGRARALATDDATYERRRAVVGLAASLASVSAAAKAAAVLVEKAEEESAEATARIDRREREELDQMYGVVERGRRPREYAPALRDLDKSQRQRAKRRVLDVVDRGLMDLVSVYRDAISLQVGATAALVNEADAAVVRQVAETSSPEQNLHRIDAIFTAREQMLEFNVAPILALESMMMALRTRTA